MSSVVLCQQLFYSNTLHGGVTGNGGGNGSGETEVNLDLLIPPGSSVVKAFLLAANDYNISNTPLQVTLNGDTYTFDHDNIVSSGFRGTCTSPSVINNNATINVIDISEEIDPDITHYTLAYPAQPTLEGLDVYRCFNLYVVYENLELPLISVNLFLNNQNTDNLVTYNLQGFNPVLSNYPIGLEVYTSDFCDTSFDGSNVYVNDHMIGLLGGDDSTQTSIYCSSPFPNYGYSNHTLYGMADDNPDSLMYGTDATADIKGYMNNHDTSVEVTFEYVGQYYGWRYTNPIRALALNYVSTCETFTTHLLTADTAICRGGSVQLGVSGGTAYHWLPEKDLSCYDCAEPVFTGDSTQTYTVRIANGDSCSKVLPVRVLVHPIPEPAISIADAFCDPYNGKVVLTRSDAAFYTLANDTNTTGSFSGLMSGDFPVSVTDIYGCNWQDTVTVGVNSPAIAAFTASPDSGYSPLSVNLTHTGSGANTITWQAAGMEAYGATAQLIFPDSGTYTLAEIACWKEYPCCDTAYATITVFPGIDVILPNIITPNGDGRNDNLVAQVSGVKSMQWQVYNRWGRRITSGEVSDPETSVVLWVPGQGQFAAGVYTVAMRVTGYSGEVRQIAGQVQVVE